MQRRREATKLWRNDKVHRGSLVFSLSQDFWRFSEEGRGSHPRPVVTALGWGKKNGAPLTGMLAANKRLRTRNTHPQDMVALRATSRDLHTLRTSHGWVPLRLFIGFMAACEPAELGYPLSTATHRVHVVSWLAAWCACVVTWQEITPTRFLWMQNDT